MSDADDSAARPQESSGAVQKADAAELFLSSARSLCAKLARLIMPEAEAVLQTADKTPFSPEESTPGTDAETRQKDDRQ